MIVEDVGEGPGDDPHLRRVVPHPLHRESFAGAGLAVGEDRSVEALKHGVHQRGKGFFVLDKQDVYLLLSRLNQRF